MSDSDVARQRDYYRATADTYYERHVGEQDEHGLALAMQVLKQAFPAFDALLLLRAKFGQLHVMNIQGCGEVNLLGAVSHVAILARRQDASISAA